MKGFIELHYIGGNEPFMLNVNLIAYIGNTGNVMVLNQESAYFVEESYEEIVSKIKEAMDG